MRDFFGKYNRNRKFIWLIIGISAVILVLINCVKDEFKPEYSEGYNSEENVIRETFHDTSYSVIDSQQIDNKTNNNITDIIKQFINYCNEGKVESAYDILSQECKDALYPTLEEFESNYYSVNFEERKTYNMQAWLVHNNRFIYKIELLEDMLSTGKKSNVKKQDYFIVVKENDKYYLNISSLVEKNVLNAYKKVDTMEFFVESIEIFIQQVNLNMTITNNSRKSILLDSGEFSDTVFIKDSKGLENISSLYEYDSSDLIIPKKTSKEFKIKFIRSYTVDNIIETVNFEDIILEYEENNKKMPTVTIDI